MRASFYRQSCRFFFSCSTLITYASKKLENVCAIERLNLNAWQNWIGGRIRGDRMCSQDAQKGHLEFCNGSLRNTLQPFTIHVVHLNTNVIQFKV